LRTLPRFTGRDIPAGLVRLAPYALIGWSAGT